MLPAPAIDEGDVGAASLIAIAKASDEQRADVFLLSLGHVNIVLSSNWGTLVASAEFIDVVSLVSVVIPWQRWQLCQRPLRVGKPLYEYRS
ncbi:MAG: hypothetical protein ACLPSH_10275 [Vulcanimicrobiaceae bacterium]